MKKLIVLVGSYPLPFGGNSVHVQRLHRALRDEFRVEVIDLYSATQVGDDASILRCGVRPNGMLRALIALRRSRAPIVHFHVSGFNQFLWAAYPLLTSLASATRPIITVHSGSFVKSFESGPAWRRAMLRNLLRNFHQIITVNHDQRRFIEGLGIDSGRLKVVPAFLPPVTSESVRTREILARLSCDRVIVASGCGLPHYGFHVILDALARQDDARRTGLVICAYDSYDEAYMAKLVQNRKVTCTIVRDLDPGEFAWILEQSDVYVRATDRDGDAVAIREASYFGKAVIASDCVERPPYAMLFRTGDAESLALALQSSWNERGASAAAEGGRAGLDALLDIYHEVLETPSSSTRSGATLPV